MDRRIEIIAEVIDKATPGLSSLGSSLGALGGIGSAIATGGLALAGAAVAGIAAGAVLAGKAIWDFSQDTNEAMKLFGAQTGLAGDELDEFKDIAKDVYAAGLGDTIGDVVEQMGLVVRGLGETGSALEDSTRRAMTLADVFNVDVAESVKWVSSMTKSWKINSEDAFDVITKGMQMGLDVAGDFGDTLHEYSGDFDRLGFTADQTLSILNAGLEAGAYNTDVIADGFREMGLRLTEGGEDMSEVFASMGLDFEAISASVAAGDETWGDYTETITSGLMAIDDELVRNAAGVEIFGTKWEDVGGEVFLAAGQATEGIEGIGGATDAAAEQMATGLGPALERLKRTFITEFAPLGDKAGAVINKMVPYLELAADWLGEKIPLAIDWLERTWEEYWPMARDTLIRFWQGIQPGLNWLRDTFQRFTSAYLPHLRSAWDNLKQGWTEIKDMYNTQLKPALTDLWAALGLGKVKTGDIAGAFGTFMGILERLRSSMVLDVIKGAISLVTWHIEQGVKAVNFWKGAFESLKRVLEKVGNIIIWVKDKIWEAINALNNLHLPDWLTPGSPTPLELGLLGIGKAFTKLEKMPGVNMLAEGVTGNIGGYAATRAPTTITITNHFGRDSVRTDQDMKYITNTLDEQLRALELQGGRSRIQ